MASFITPDELKAYPLPVTAKQWQLVGDDQLEIVIESASDHLEDYMDRPVLSAAHIDRRYGSGSEKMLLEIYPTTALSSAYSYDGLGNQTVWNTDEFYINTNAGILEFIQRDRYNFIKSYVWEIHYTAGYSTVPSPIKHATALQTVKMLQPLFRGGTNFVETELITDIDENIMELLEAYKRRRIS